MRAAEGQSLGRIELRLRLDLCSDCRCHSSSRESFFGFLTCLTQEWALEDQVETVARSDGNWADHEDQQGQHGSMRFGEEFNAGAEKPALYGDLNDRVEEIDAVGEGSDPGEGLPSQHAVAPVLTMLREICHQQTDAEAGKDVSLISISKKISDHAEQKHWPEPSIVPAGKSEFRTQHAFSKQEKKIDGRSTVREVQQTMSDDEGNKESDPFSSPSPEQYE